MADPWPFVVEAVNARRLELGLSWRQLSRNGGPSESTLQKLRLRFVPLDTDTKRAQLCHALQWEASGIDRILAGEEPIDLRESNVTPIRPEGPTMPAVASALESLAIIQQQQIAVLQALVEELRKRPEQR